MNKKIGSRTVLGDGLKTYWSSGDQLYVCGRQGQVHGVLTLKEGAGTETGTFEGYIKGGPSKDLQHVVFPAPKDNKIDMSNRGNGLNVPMIGAMSDGAITGGLKNVGAVVTFDVADGHGYPAKALDESNTNLAAGSYTFNPQNGTLTYNADGLENRLVGTYVNNGKAYLPVATSLNPISSTSAATFISNVTVEVNVDGVPVSMGGITVESGKIYGDGATEDTDALEIKLVKDATELKNAIAVGGYVKLSNDISVTERLYVNSGVTLALDLDENTLTGEGLTGSVLVNNGILILKNGTVTDKDAKVAVPGLNNNGEAVLNCTIISNSSNAIQNNSTGKLTIEGGHYESKNPEGQALRMNAWHGEDEAGAWELYINGGTFIGKWAGLYMAENYEGLSEGGIARIYNATFEGNPEVKAGENEGSNRSGGDIIFEAVKNVTIKNCTLKTKSIHSLTTEVDSEINEQTVTTNGNLYSTLFE